MNATRPAAFLRSAAAVAVLAAVYWIAARAGLMLAFVNASASAVWPPTGIAIAAFLLWGGWPTALGVWAGAWCANMATTGQLVSSTGIATGNTLEGWLGALLAIRFAGGRDAFRTAPGLLAFAGLAGLLAPMVSASVGVASLFMTGNAARPDLAAIWTTWWLGDAAGALLVTPCIILWAARPRFDWAPRRIGEIALLLGTLGLVAHAVFGGGIGASAAHLPVAFLFLPFLVWTAFRFGPRESATLNVLLSAFAVGGTLRGFGPFVHDSANTSLLLVQGFTATNGVVSLLLAALMAAQREAVAALTVAGTRLQERVAERTRELSTAETALAQRIQMDEALLTALDDLDEGLAIVDEATGRFLRANRALCRIYGYTEEELKGLASYWELVAPEERANLRSRRQLRAAGQEVPDHYELTVVHRLGHRLRIEVAMKTLRREEGTWIISLVRDVTNRKLAEDLQRAKDMAEASNQAKSRFLAIVSHELRTPLTSIIGFANLLLRDRAAAAPPTERHYLERILDNGRGLLEEINDLLDLGKIEAGRVAVDTGEVGLSAFLADICAQFELQARAKGLSLSLELAPGPGTIVTDAVKLRRIMLNLVANAIKFTDSGGISLRARTAGGDAVLEVADTGIGIPEGMRAAVFEPFEQGDEGRGRKYGGAGLGLAICRSLTELLGGTLDAAAAPGGGTVFTLRLPGAAREGAPPAGAGARKAGRHG